MGRAWRIRPRLGRGWRRALAVLPRASRAKAGRSPGTRSASPRSARRSAISASSPTWRRCGTGCAGSSTGSGDAATLNLFGYTGVGTLALSQVRPGHPCRCDQEIGRPGARECRRCPTCSDRPIRWLVDDAAKFAAREVRRGKRYDGIILDPPKFGRGPEGEVWRLEEGLPGLIADCRALLDAESRFLFLTVYAVRMSSLALAGLLAEHFADLPGRIEHGDLAVREEGEEGRLLPTAIFARWTSITVCPPSFHKVEHTEWPTASDPRSSPISSTWPHRDLLGGDRQAAAVALHRAGAAEADPSTTRPTPRLDASNNYMDLKFACFRGARATRHFKLIEAVAEHVCETLFLHDTRIEEVSVKIVKLALSEADEKIGITLTRERR